MSPRSSSQYARSSSGRLDSEVAGSSQSSYPPIEDYALIGDGRILALISNRGSVDWLCLPRFSSPSIFSRLLDTQGGRFFIRPRIEFDAKWEYLKNTTVLQTSFQTKDGAARVIDCVPIADGLNELHPMREVLRIIEGICGETDFEICIDLRPDYARKRPTLRHGTHLGWRYNWSNEFLAVRTDAGLDQVGQTLRGTLRVRAGERRYVSLSYSQADPGVFTLLGADADQRLDATLEWWQAWSRNCTYVGPYKDAVLRSALTLKLLSYALSGAIVAAPTTSLPERIGDNRNWDYRYCWLRDAGLTMQAFVGLGLRDEARGFLSWLLHATRLTWPELQIMYDVYGRTNLREEELSHLEGYRGSRPVRIGNGAHSQRQLDVYGEVILAADVYVASGGTLEPVECRMLAGFGKVVCNQWRKPDHGIWETRGEPKQYTFSKLMCWVALDRLLKLNQKGIVSLGLLANQFCRQRDAIAATIEELGFNPGVASYVSELNGSAIDASLLLMPCVGYKSANDPRVMATYERTWQRLGRNGLLYRYEPADNQLGSREGAFGICSFWAAHHLACRPDMQQARKVFDHVLSFASNLGLFAEEIDPDTGAALGNFPQAFSHVGLINAALAIESSSELR